MDTTIVYRPKITTINARLHHYAKKDGTPDEDILVLKIKEAADYLGDGGELSIQGSPAEMKKFLAVVGRVLRHPEETISGPHVSA
jgi:hypothetical protein